MLWVLIQYMESKVGSQPMKVLCWVFYILVLCLGIHLISFVTWNMVLGVTGDRIYSAKEWFVWGGTLLIGFGVLLLLLEVWFRWIFIPRINRAAKEIKDVSVED